MDRRTLLKWMATASLLGGRRHLFAGEPLRVVVAGGGIIGASIAFHLARSGAAVTVIDREGPATHASRGTFAWINATWAKQPRHYHALNQDSVAYWKELQKILDIPVRWRGSLEWFGEARRQEKLGAQIAEQAAWGERARMVNADEMARFEPQVDFAGARQAAFSENDGAVDPVVATRLLLSAAQGMGASVKYPCELTAVSLRGGRLAGVETSQGAIAADRLVLATGAAADAALRFANVDIPQRSTPGVIAITAPAPPLLNGIIAAPGVHMHQRGDGRIVLGEQGGAPQNTAHDERLKERPNTFPTASFAAQHAERMLAVAERFLPAIKGTAIENVYIGWRPMPVDGHPVLGHSPAAVDVYLAVMHSGVTLAPIVGKLVTQELINGASLATLEAFRPGRKFEVIKRY